MPSRRVDAPVLGRAAEGGSAHTGGGSPHPERTSLAEACRNRTNPSTLPRRNNGFEDRGSHQTPFASGGTGTEGGGLEFRRRVRSRRPHSTFNIYHSPVFFLLSTFAFLFGAITGSFLNVV